MPHLPTPDGDIYYEVQGDGPPIVLLRGLGRSLRYWHGFDTEMAQSFKIITLDMRGIGRTTRMARYADSLFDLADDVMLVLDHLGEQAVHILGVSLGGMIALASGLKHPHRCRSLIVINTSIAGQWALRLSPFGTKILLQGSTYRKADIHDLLADVLTGEAYASRKELAEKYRKIAAEEGMPQATVFRQLLGAARFRVRKQLGNLQVPTLVMYGTQDRFVPVVNSEKLFRLLPHAQLAAIEGGGHELAIDRPQEVKEAVREWVRTYR